jgi:(R,R)-butanediol dehydrogenase / meso-butanediol dehydrogenase / diacetyl reductase
MKAVIFDGSPVPAIADVPVPVPDDNQCLLKVLRGGICGTDLSILSGKHPRATAPLVLGHEIAARVVRPDAAGTLTEGELVTLEPIISCGRCVACRSGYPHVCQKLRLYGIDVDGGLAEFIVVNADRVIRAPETMSPETLVLAEPLAVAVHAVRSSGIRYGDRVCVIGGGPVGLMVAMIAAETTPFPILVSEPQAERRAVAQSLGFPVVDPTTESLEERVVSHSGERVMDVVFETAGSQPAILSSTRILRPRGTLVQVSIPKEERSFNLVDLTFKELVVKGIRVYEPFDFQYALEFLERSADQFSRFLSVPFELDAAKDAFDAARAGNRGLRVYFRIGE